MKSKQEIDRQHHIIPKPKNKDRIMEMCITGYSHNADDCGIPFIPVIHIDI